MQATLDAQGVAPMMMSRAEFDAFLVQEIERWRTVVASLAKSP
jgi:tripartite-type tricarboxylate transporter receptor subunit TctC